MHPTSERQALARISAIVALICAVAAFVGSLGPWVRGAVVFWGELNVSGYDGTDGKVSLGVSIVVALAALCVLGGIKRPVLPIVAAIGFVLIAIIGVANFLDIQDKVNNAETEGIIASVGWGIYLVLIGGVMGTIAAIIYIALTHQPRKSVEGGQTASTSSAVYERSQGLDLFAIVFCLGLALWLSVVVLGFLVGAGAP